MAESRTKEDRYGPARTDLRRKMGHVPDDKEIEAWTKAINDGIQGDAFNSRFRVTLSHAREMAKRAGKELPPRKRTF